MTVTVAGIKAQLSDLHLDGLRGHEQVRVIHHQFAKARPGSQPNGLRQRLNDDHYEFNSRVLRELARVNWLHHHQISFTTYDVELHGVTVPHVKLTQPNELHRVPLPDLVVGAHLVADLLDATARDQVFARIRRIGPHAEVAACHLPKPFEWSTHVPPWHELVNYLMDPLGWVLDPARGNLRDALATRIAGPVVRSVAAAARTAPSSPELPEDATDADALRWLWAHDLECRGLTEFEQAQFAGTALGARGTRRLQILFVLGVRQGSPSGS